MPNYTFHCPSCGPFEAFAKVGTAKAPCPACKKTSKKTLSAPQIHFKGSGFYKTDSKAQKPTPKKD
jgi:putative FmdB family regulatory protein